MTTEELAKIKADTLKDENIVFVDKAYRYVNHELKLLTTGWAEKDKLILGKRFIRFDEAAIERMQNRYKIAEVFKML